MSWASFVHVIVLFHLQVQHYLGVINNFSSTIVNRKLVITEFSMPCLLGTHYCLILLSTVTQFIFILLKNVEKYRITNSPKNTCSSKWFDVTFPLKQINVQYTCYVHLVSKGIHNLRQSSIGNLCFLHVKD